MKKTTCLIFIVLFCFTQITFGFQISKEKLTEPQDTIQALKDTLTAISNRTNNELFKLSCESILLVINSKKEFSPQETAHLNETYRTFISSADPACPINLESYLKRQRSFIIAWISPTDQKVSLARYRVPKNWKADQSYPLYVFLHGYLDRAVNPIEYMTRFFRHKPGETNAFEDGFWIEPWGRGNNFYLGIGETDIWECIQAIEKVTKINPERKYLLGHSMGGYGTWNIGQKLADKWAAIGVYAGAFIKRNNLPYVLTGEVAENLSKTPVLIICGEDDGLLEVNQIAYNLLKETGNKNIEFEKLKGGHHYFNYDNIEKMYDWLKQYPKLSD